jgi:hypothetical protein
VSLSDVHLVAEEGISISDARQVSLHSVHIDTKAGAAITAEKSERLDLFDVGSLVPHADAPTIVLSDVKSAHVHGCFAAENTGVFLEVKGAQSRDILVESNHLAAAKTTVMLGEGAGSDAVRGIEPTGGAVATPGKAR